MGREIGEGEGGKTGGGTCVMTLGRMDGPPALLRFRTYYGPTKLMCYVLQWVACYIVRGTYQSASPVLVLCLVAGLWYLLQAPLVSRLALIVFNVHCNVIAVTLPSNLVYTCKPWIDSAYGPSSLFFCPRPFHVRL